MSDDELTDTVSQYTSDGNVLPNDPGVIDALSAELRNRDMGAEHQLVREVALKRNYNSPWLQTPAGKLLSHELELNNSKDGNEILCDVTEGEKIGMIGFSIENLAEEVRNDERSEE